MTGDLDRLQKENALLRDALNAIKDAFRTVLADERPPFERRDEIVVLKYTDESVPVVVGHGGGGSIQFDIPGPHGGGGGPIRAALASINPRDAFEAGFDAGADWCAAGENYDSPVSPVELAWEHFQAERMKAAAATESESCGWRREDEGSDLWITDCGHEFIINEASTPDECGMKFCHHCGERMKAAATDEPDTVEICICEKPKMKFEIGSLVYCEICGNAIDPERYKE